MLQDSKFIHTRTSPAGHGGAAGRSVMAEALWEPPNPTLIFHFVSRLSSGCPVSQHQIWLVPRYGPVDMTFFYFQMNQCHGKSQILKRSDVSNHLKSCTGQHSDCLTYLYDRTQGFRPMVSSAVWGKAPAARKSHSKSSNGRFLKRLGTRVIPEQPYEHARWLYFFNKYTPLC